jgi:hypothetical protein
MIEQYPYERRVRLQALQDITNQMGLAPGTEASYGLGNRMAGATEQTLSSAPGMGPMPGQYYDPIEQGLSSEIERSLAGNLPAAHLDRECSRFVTSYFERTGLGTRRLRQVSRPFRR